MVHYIVNNIVHYIVHYIVGITDIVVAANAPGMPHEGSNPSLADRVPHAVLGYATQDSNPSPADRFPHTACYLNV